MIVIWPSLEKSNNPWLASLYATFPPHGHEVKGFRGVGTLLYRPDILIINWIESPLNKGGLHFTFVFYRLLVLYMARLMGTKIIWVVHNAVPHDRRLGVVGRWYLRLIVRMASILVSMNVETEKMLSNALRLQSHKVASKLRFVPHGPYMSVYTELDGSRGTVEYDFGFFGALRKYKNVADYIESRNLLSIGSVVVAGPLVDQEQAERLRQIESASHGRLTLIGRYLSNKDLYKIQRSCRVVVIPYGESEMNSGLANLAISIGVPVLGPDVPALRQARRDWGSQHLIYETELGSWPCISAKSLDTESRASALECERLEGWRRVLIDIGAFAGRPPS